MWQSKAPTLTTTSVFNPRRVAHSALSFPAGLSAVYVSLKRRSVNPFSRGSSDEKNTSGGSPLYSADHNALCPAEHTPRFRAWTLLPPVSRKGIQSQCSTQE